MARVPRPDTVAPRHLDPLIDPLASGLARLILASPGPDAEHRDSVPTSLDLSPGLSLTVPAGEPAGEAGHAETCARQT